MRDSEQPTNCTNWIPLGLQTGEIVNRLHSQKTDTLSEVVLDVAAALVLIIILNEAEWRPIWWQGGQEPENMPLWPEVAVLIAIRQTQRHKLVELFIG